MSNHSKGNNTFDQYSSCDLLIFLLRITSRKTKGFCTKNCAVHSRAGLVMSNKWIESNIDEYLKGIFVATSRCQCPCINGAVKYLSQHPYLLKKINMHKLVSAWLFYHVLPKSAYYLE